MARGTVARNLLDVVRVRYGLRSIDGYSELEESFNLSLPGAKGEQGPLGIPENLAKTVEAAPRDRPDRPRLLGHPAQDKVSPALGAWIL
ncbi:hypothetical protein JOD67_000364 [Tenggerimyces flavus]|nr:hypothetical protein [Tenggerimyces flavus]